MTPLSHLGVSGRDLSQCPECAGTGYVDPRNDECPICEGTGDRYGRGPTLPPPPEADA
jgi:hypothetical protein